MKTLYAIQEIKAAYPQAEYVDGDLYLEDQLVETDVDELIAEYYDDFEVTRASWDNDPQKEYFEKVSGREYIKIHFYGSYEDAYNEI